MKLAHYAGWCLLALATLTIALVPSFVNLPLPQGAIVIDRAVLSTVHNATVPVSLPLVIFPHAADLSATTYYDLQFDLSSQPDHELFLLIPSINRPISMTLNGEALSEAGATSLWLGPLTSMPLLIDLPAKSMRKGRNTVNLTVNLGGFAVPTYISRIYIGPESIIVPIFEWRNIFQEQLKTMTFAAYVLLGLSLICAAVFRPRDRMLWWLAAFIFGSLIVSMAMFAGFQGGIRFVLPYFATLVPTVAALFLCMTLALVDVKPPKALIWVGIYITAILLCLPVTGTVLTKTILEVTTGIVAILGNVAGTAILAWGIVRRRSVDAGLMIAPTFLQAWFAAHDFYIGATLPQHEFNVLLPYVRPLLLAAMTIVLMRRMAKSLDQLDQANETLAVKLADREAELAELYEQERIKAGYRVREQERHRLTQDLHDGISGHLASIVALSERSGEQSIEKAARDALSDLRLVIYSLDLGDKELPLALANLRDRLIPQLQRLGVHLDWSMARLPEVSGVTPGNALAVLRILQEAITNALKHGPARTIRIRGAMTADGKAAITLENDGRPFIAQSDGYGLKNMRARAAQLRGELTVENITSGVKLTLLFPTALPDFEDDAAYSR